MPTDSLLLNFVMLVLFSVFVYVIISLQVHDSVLMFELSIKLHPIKELLVFCLVFVGSLIGFASLD